MEKRDDEILKSSDEKPESRHVGWRALLRPRYVLVVMLCVWLFGVARQHGPEILMPGFVDYWDTWRLRIVSSLATLWLIMGGILAGLIAGVFALFHRVRNGKFHPDGLSTFIILVITFQGLFTLGVGRDDGIRNWSDELGRIDVANRRASDPPKSQTQWTDPTNRYTVDFPTAPTRHDLDGAYAYQATNVLNGRGALYALTVAPFDAVVTPGNELLYLREANTAFIRSMGIPESNVTLFENKFLESREDLGYSFTSIVDGTKVTSLGFWVFDQGHAVRVSVMYEASLDEANAALTHLFPLSFEILE